MNRARAGGRTGLIVHEPKVSQFSASELIKILIKSLQTNLGFLRGHLPPPQIEHSFVQLREKSHSLKFDPVQFNLHDGSCWMSVSGR